MFDTNQDEERWLIYKTPLGKYCKVSDKRKNVAYADWQPIVGAMFYNRDGSLNEMGDGIIEIVNREQARWYSSPAAHDFGMIIGMING